MSIVELLVDEGRLSADQLATALTSLPAWTGSRSAIERTVAAPDFPTAIRIVSEVAEVAEVFMLNL